VGVAAPKTMTLASHTDVAEVADFLYPCAIKPINSHVFSRQFRPAAKGAYVNSHPEVVELVTPLIDQGIPMLLTEVVEGSDECCSYYSYLDADGTPLTHFTKRKLRQYPIRFGSGTYHMTKWNPEVAELGLRFFQGIGLRGLGMVEFKRDARDGALKLIESNPRFSLANELVRAAGIDFGRLAYNRLVGLPLPPLDSFRDDLALWLVIDDLRAGRAYCRDGELTPQTWAKSLLHRQCAAEFDWRDPGPSLANVASRAANLVRRVSPRPETGHGARRSAGPYATR
jgi:predicted ATP-grasp superfamily ATP-dependent carboligase